MFACFVHSKIIIMEHKFKPFFDVLPAVFKN